MIINNAYKERIIKMNITEKVAEIICRVADISKEQINVSHNINLITDLNLDSIKIVELIVVLENEFDINITDEYLDLNIISNFNELVALVERLS